MPKQFIYEQLNKTIEEYGWLVTGVPNGLLYTVGMMGLGHPELAVHGLHPDQAHGVLVDAVARVKEGASFRESGSLHKQVLKPPYMVQSIVVHPSNYWDWVAQGLGYNGPGLEVVQLLWPDKAGRYPGDPLYDLRYFQLRFDIRRPEYDQL